LYFVCDDGTHGYELWKTDGTTTGTSMVKDISEGATGSSASILINFNNTLYFVAARAGEVATLWTSDGTAEGTVTVKDNGGGFIHNPSELNVIDDNLFFRNDFLLWRYKGKGGGIETFDFSRDSTMNYPHLWGHVNGKLYVTAFIDAQTTGLWRAV